MVTGTTRPIFGPTASKGPLPTSFIILRESRFDAIGVGILPPTISVGIIGTLLEVQVTEALSVKDSVRSESPVPPPTSLLAPPPVSEPS